MLETIFDRSCDDDDDDDTVVVHKVYTCLMRMVVCCSWQADARTQSHTQTLAITYTSSISWDVEKLMSIFLSEIKIKCKRTRLVSCY